MGAVELPPQQTLSNEIYKMHLCLSDSYHSVGDID